MEIKLDNITGKNTKINNLSFKIDKKQIIGLISIDSSDGSDILKIVAGKTILSEGKVEIDKKNLEKYEQYIGFMPRISDICFSYKTIKEELENNLKIKKYKKEETKERIEKALKIAELDNSYLNKNPLNLSISEQQKLQLSICLSHNPKVILMDEPSIGIDFQYRQILIKHLKMMSFRYNKMILINSNDTDFLMEVADYIYILENGKIINHGDKYTIFKWIIKEKKNILIPKIIEFSTYVKETKNISLGYRSNLDDLAKDIYRSA